MHRRSPLCLRSNLDRAGNLPSISTGNDLLNTARFPKAAVLHAESQSKADHQRKLGVDKCWGRAAMACGAILFSSAVHSTAGFFYVAFMREYGVNHAEASWPISVYEAFDEAGGLIAFAFLRGFTVSKIGIIGGVLVSSGIIASLFAPDMAWMSLTFGFVQGVGSGLVSMAVTVILMMYFDRYRGIATGICDTGYSLSSLIYSPILALLDQVFPFRQLLLIFAGISLHMTPLLLALKEPPWTRKSGAVINSWKRTTLNNCDVNLNAFTQSKEHGALAEVETAVDPESILNRAADTTVYGSINIQGVDGEKVRTKRESCSDRSARTGLIKTNCSSNQLSTAAYECVKGMRVNSTRSVTKGSIDAKASAPRRLTLEMEDERTNLILPIDSPANVDETTRPPQKERASIAKFVLTPTFWTVVLGAALAEYSDCTFMATLVDSGLDRGATRLEAVLTIMCSAPSELMGRAVLPLLADVGLVSRTTLSCICYFVFAAVVMALSMTRSFATYAPCAAAGSLLLGCLTTMKHVVTADYFGVDAVTTAWAATGAIVLPLMLSNPFIMGFFREKQGSYDNLYYSLGSAHLLMGAVFLLLRYSTDRRRKRWTAHSDRL